MKNDTTRVKAILKYLRTLPATAFHKWQDIDAVAKHITKMGAEFINSGCFAMAYKVDGFVVKLSTQNFNQLRAAKSNEAFKRFAPPIYWMHESGHALLCKFVSWLGRLNYDRHDRYRKAFKNLLSKYGFVNVDDLHESNLVRVKVGGRLTWQIIDYGCWTGNC